MSNLFFQFFQLEIKLEITIFVVLRHQCIEGNTLKNLCERVFYLHSAFTSAYFIIRSKLAVSKTQCLGDSITVL